MQRDTGGLLRKRGSRGVRLSKGRGRSSMRAKARRAQTHDNGHARPDKTSHPQSNCTHTHSQPPNPPVRGEALDVLATWKIMVGMGASESPLHFLPHAPHLSICATEC